MINRKTSRDLVFINTLVKKLEWKKYYRKNGTWTHNVLSIEFLESLIGYNSKTTPPRVKILPPVDFLGSNYPNKKFSSRNSKFSVFDTLAFFSTNNDNNNIYNYIVIYNLLRNERISFQMNFERVVVLINMYKYILIEKKRECQKLKILSFDSKTL